MVPGLASLEHYIEPLMFKVQVIGSQFATSMQWDIGKNYEVWSMKYEMSYVGYEMFTDVCE